ncbi:MAG: ATP-binding protein [Gemella sp.]|nr:ATP-binding protein [Gemella sp.]
MTRKIFKALLGVVTLVLVVSFSFITMFLYDYFEEDQQKKLKENLSLISSVVEKEGITYLEGAHNSEYRISWINSEGRVLFDSRANAEYMENHSDREEVIEARNYGRGSSIRESETLTERTLYESQRLEDNSILRVSIKTATVKSLLLKLISPLLIIYIFIILVTIFVSKSISRKMVAPLNEVDLDNPLPAYTYEELLPLLRRIDDQNKKIERQISSLNRRKEEFDKVVNHMKEGLVLLDENKNILSINRAAIDIFGNEQIKIGDNILRLERNINLQNEINKAFENSRSNVILSVDDKNFQYDMNRIEYNNKILGLVILIVDVTDRFQNEKLRREFTANVSHEFKTPLQSILGSVELIENGIVKTEDMPRFTNHIKSEANRLVALVNDVISLAQLDEGTSFAKENVDLRSIVDEVYSALTLVAKDKNIILEVSGRAKLEAVRTLVYTMIYNLCDNAIKYNKENGKVSVTVSEINDEAVFYIEDTGLGIAETDKERIFERFYRVDKSHSKQSGGTGLGLAIVKNVIKHHKGKLEIESELGVGTKVIIKFPKNKEM